MALLATNRWPGDGSTTEYTISFSGGYIDKSHVKAAFEDPITFARTMQTLTSEMFVGPYQIDTSLGPSPIPPAPIGTNFLLYRDTPKTGPLVDFQGGSRITEANLDKVAQQSVFIGAETADATQADYIIDIVNSVGTAVDAAADAAASAAAAAASAATINPSNFATAAQGAKADTALQPADVSGDTSIARQTSATGATKISAGTTAQRPGSPQFGWERANSDTGKMEYWDGSAWSPMGGGATGGGTDAVFWVNDPNVTQDYTIPSGKNAGNFGGITVATGKAVTVPTGSSLTVV